MKLKAPQGTNRPTALKKPTHNIAIVASQFNDSVTKRLLDGCLVELKRLGLDEKHITTVWVPGAFEAPIIAQTLAKKKNIDAVICLGAVIRGETYHFETVCNESARGLMNVGLSTGKPIINGILTTDTVDQAYKRSQEKGGENKGRDCALAVVDMLELLKAIK